MRTMREARGWTVIHAGMDVVAAEEAALVIKMISSKSSLLWKNGRRIARVASSGRGTKVQTNEPAGQERSCAPTAAGGRDGS